MHTARVERIIHGTLIREGAGVKLQRYVGADASNSLEPILLFDYFNSTDVLDYMAGFPAHPHRGFETITYVLHGHITHEDNKGHKGVIGPGDVQWMTAGKGIIHSEMPVAEHGRFQGLQLWLNLPAAEKMQPARYQEIASAKLPIEEQDGGQIKVIAGRTDKGTCSPIVDIATNPLLLDISLSKNAVFTQHIPEGYQTVLFVIAGSVQLADITIKADVFAVLSPDRLIELKAAEHCHCLLLSAAQLKEPIVRHGPFVMNTTEEIKQAIADVRLGLF